MIIRRIGLLTALFCLCTALGADQRKRDESPKGSKPLAAVEETSKASIPKDSDRSPLSVAVSPDRRYCVSANHTAASVSLIDLNNAKVLTEYRCGRGPVDVAWVDSTTLLVSLLHDDAVVLLKRNGSKLITEATIPVGDQPRGIALVGKSQLAPASGVRTAAAGRAFVAVSGADEVVVVDLATRRVAKRIAVGGDPRTLAVAPNQRWLVTCCSVPGEVLVHDTGTYKLLSRRRVFDDAFNLGVPVVLPDSSLCIFPHPINRTFPVSEDNIEKGWVIDNRLTKLPLPEGKYWQQKQVGLDKRGNAAGDINAVAVNEPATWLVATCGGSHELLIMPQKEIPWPVADPGDFLPEDMRDKQHLFRRVELGGRPVDVDFIDDRRVVVANYLKNELQIVDVAEAKLVRTIALGGPKKPSLARQGEALFYDADRSLNSWFSCHTCHTDGHTNGQTFDTLNDGNYGMYKLTPSLRAVSRTGPWTWHGWQKSLHAAMRKSLRDTLSTELQTKDQDVQALVAFLSTLEPPRSPHRQPNGELTAAARRGRELFVNKAGCVDCHGGKDFTANATYKVGLESNFSFYPEFNPPTLRGLHTKRRFLHDGRAENLKEVLTQHHRPEKLAGEKLTDKELHDLIAYLKSL